MFIAKALTLVNMVLLVLQADVMLLFSATVPYYAVAFGMALGSSSFLGGCICFAAIILLVYLLCWMFSKKHYGWMIAALVLFVLDSFFMVRLYLSLEDFSGILDVVIHVWVLYYLVIGVKYGHQLKKMPEEMPVASEETNFFGESKF